MKIIVLKEGNYSVTQKKEFRLLETVSNVSDVKIAVQPFLIITKKDFILLDTGLGFDYKDEPIIYNSLKKENIHPEQITKILISHLHKDHIGGVLHFPNAKIYIQQRELDFALTQQSNPSYDFEVVNNLTTLPNIVLLNEDSGKISDEIFFEVSGGHTPFHQEFWIKENGETIFYGADNLPKRDYLQVPIALKNDYDGKKALELRKRWKNDGSNEHWKILLYHDLETPVY